jgi:hypothetical protein
MAMRLATIAAAFVLFSAPLAIEAQQRGKVYRVGTDRALRRLRHGRKQCGVERRSRAGVLRRRSP